MRSGQLRGAESPPSFPRGQAPPAPDPVPSQQDPEKSRKEYRRSIRKVPNESLHWLGSSEGPCSHPAVMGTAA